MGTSIKHQIQYFISQIFTNRRLIIELTKRDFKNKYIKNYFGLAWAILDPLFFMLVLYFVFHYRFNTKDLLGVPFVTYLLSGYIAFDFFSSTLSSVPNCIKSYSFLIKKINFHSAIIPLVKIASNLFMHLIITIIVLTIIWCTGIHPTIYWVQIIYYQFSMTLLLVGIGWVTSSIYLFFPDIKNIINIISRLLFFLTPIFWSLEGLPEKYIRIMKLNPLTYVVEGYRSSLLYNIYIWNDIPYTIYFWIWVFVFLVLGIFIFKKLRPHFADVV